MLTLIAAIVALCCSATPATQPTTSRPATRPSEYTKALTTASITPELSRLKAAYSKPTPWSRGIESLESQCSGAKGPKLENLKRTIAGFKVSERWLHEKTTEGREKALKTVTAMQAVSMCIATALVHIDYGDLAAATQKLDAAKPRLKQALEPIPDVLDGNHKPAVTFDDCDKAQADFRTFLDAAYPRIVKAGLKIDYKPTEKPAPATQPAKSTVNRRSR